MAYNDPSGKSDISIPGFKTRHLVELRALSWPSLLDLIDWLQDEGHVAYFRTKTEPSGIIEAAFGAESISGDSLASQMSKRDGLDVIKIEHLLVNEASTT